jgi:hypothetical protein
MLLLHFRGHLILAKALRTSDLEAGNGRRSCDCKTTGKMIYDDNDNDFIAGIDRGKKEPQCSDWLQGTLKRPRRGSDKENFIERNEALDPTIHSDPICAIHQKHVLTRPLFEANGSGSCHTCRHKPASAKQPLSYTIKPVLRAGHV